MRAAIQGTDREGTQIHEKFEEFSILSTVRATKTFSPLLYSWSLLLSLALIAQSSE
jgi:hypothetical protein